MVWWGLMPSFQLAMGGDWCRLTAIPASPDVYPSNGLALLGRLESNHRQLDHQF